MSGNNSIDRGSDEKTIFSMGPGAGRERATDDDMVVIAPNEERKPGAASAEQGGVDVGVPHADRVISESLASRNEGELEERMVSGSERNKQIATRNVDYDQAEGGQMDIKSIDPHWDEKAGQSLYRPRGMELSTFVEVASTVHSDVGEESETFDERVNAKRRVLNESPRHPRGPHREAEQGDSPASEAEYGWSEDEAEALADALDEHEEDDQQAIPSDVVEQPTETGEPTIANRVAVVGEMEMSNQVAEQMQAHNDAEWRPTPPAFASLFPSVHTIEQETLTLKGEDTMWYEAMGMEDYDVEQLFGLARHKAFAAYNESSADMQETLDDIGETIYEQWEDEWSDVVGFTPSPKGLAAAVADHMGDGDHPRDAGMNLIESVRQEASECLIGGHEGWVTSPNYDTKITVSGTVVALFDDPAHPQQAQAGYVVDDYGRSAKFAIWKGHERDNSPDWSFHGNIDAPDRCRTVAKGDRVLFENFQVREFNGETVLESTRMGYHVSETHIIAEGDVSECPTGYPNVEGAVESPPARDLTVNEEDGPEKEVPGQKHAVRSRGWVEKQLPDTLAYRTDSDRFYDMAEKIAFHKAMEWSFPKHMCPDWFIEQHMGEDSAEDDESDDDLNVSKSEMLTLIKDGECPVPGCDYDEPHQEQLFGHIGGKAAHEDDDGAHTQVDATVEALGLEEFDA
jgi:hypothetical protein